MGRAGCPCRRYDTDMTVPVEAGRTVVLANQHSNVEVGFGGCTSAAQPPQVSGCLGAWGCRCTWVVLLGGLPVEGNFDR